MRCAVKRIIREMTIVRQNPAYSPSVPKKPRPTAVFCCLQQFIENVSGAPYQWLR